MKLLNLGLYELVSSCGGTLLFLTYLLSCQYVMQCIVVLVNSGPLAAKDSSDSIQDGLLEHRSITCTRAPEGNYRPGDKVANLHAEA